MTLCKKGGVRKKSNFECMNKNDILIGGRWSKPMSLFNIFSSNYLKTFQLFMFQFELKYLFYFLSLLLFYLFFILFSFIIDHIFRLADSPQKAVIS